MKLSSTLQKDFVASSLRHQLSIIRTALESIEGAESSDDDFIQESLKQVEIGIRKLRKITNQ